MVHTVALQTRLRSVGRNEIKIFDHVRQ
ncbi:hypothetical protein OOU_Y34scaffold00174g23 [Pyricularia oryzae Y34]|uniref:Uncharacterized protein n=2 Tax=Pyricularia oryzae TaxID=318829 RepID=A0AA97PQK7_PYRO3|nr:hypothetical protein OOU_Y34scaffold00174g23 [Pyricularia oryzae Y34]